MIAFRTQLSRGLTVGRSISRTIFQLCFIAGTPALASAQTCAQLHTEMLAAAKVYQTCVDETRGPCQNQKLTWLSLVAAANGKCNPEAWVLSAMQPDIKEGGRANTIAVNPTDDNTILVVSESGGMFRSADRGRTWAHVDTLPVFQTNAVAYLPSNPSIVIATAEADYGTVNGGGIWRSTDGGVNWTQVATPAVPPGASAPMSATEISIAPDTGAIYVASNFGLSASLDQGAHWTQLLPFAAGNPSVATVLAQSGGHLLAGGGAGVSRSIDGGSHWLTPTVNTDGITDLHAFGRSPFSPDQAYVVDASTALFYTEDAGDHWKAIASAPKGGGGAGGISFVKTVGHPGGKGTRGAKDRLDLYFSNEFEVAKLEATRSVGKTSFDYSGAWSVLKTDHSDTRDLAFDHSDNPLLLGTDGGLHHTTNKGLNWTYIGGGHDGYDALQITEIDGQWIDSLKRHDLYFGTQDNDLWSSKDLGKTWQDGSCCEGFGINSLYHVATTENDKITFTSCSGCSHEISGALFSGVVGWKDAPGAAHDPAIISKSFYVQGVAASSSLSKGLAYTTTVGSSWSQYAIMSDDLESVPLVGSIPGRTEPFVVPAAPVLYQAIVAGWSQPQNIQITQLARIVGNTAQPGIPGRTATVSYPAMNGFGGIGIDSTEFAWYQVFALDPGNPNHLIAPDVINQKVMQTFDGGDNWSEIPGLTALVTDNGRLQFTQGIFPLVSALKFDVDDPTNVALGTWGNGFFLSADNGQTWTKVVNSELVPRVTSFEWLDGQSVIASSYGRGLWRATFQRTGPVVELVERPRPALPASKEIDDVPVGKPQSPMAGRPTVNLVTHNDGGPQFAGKGQVIEVVARAHQANEAVKIVLDGVLLQQATIGTDGSLLVKITSPTKVGVHTLTVVDAATGEVTAGSMFLVRPDDPKERGEKAEKKD